MPAIGHKKARSTRAKRWLRIKIRTIHFQAHRAIADIHAKESAPGPDRRTYVSLVDSFSDDQTFDFRSSRFCADALTLARTTGRALAACRQDLFIAQGDMAMAFDWLMSGYDRPTDDPVIH